jgi:ABC-type lipoprotein export system ATPase subunit
MRMIRDVNDTRGTTVIMVTHDRGFARLADRRIYLADGRLVPEPPEPEPA